MPKPRTVGAIQMSIQPTVSKTTAEEYLKSVGDSLSNIQPQLSRMEYLALLKEANTEGRETRKAGANIESKEFWGSQTFWSSYSRELKDEFYAAYRAGYVRTKTGSDRNGIRYDR